jgi:trehalose synthase
MTSVLIEQVNAPASSRDARVREAVRRRTADELAGRTVWSATAIPAGRRSAQGLGERLRWVRESGVGTRTLDMPAAPPLRRLAQGLEEMMTGSAAQPGRLDAHDQEIYATGVSDGDAALEGRVRPGDVVVLHDPATATMADAVRDQGAHAVLQLRVTGAGRGAAAEAIAFLSGFTGHVDAFVMTVPQAPRRGVRVTRIAAVIPAGHMVAAKDVAVDAPAGEPGSPEALPSHDLGLTSLLAYLLEVDRAECVGGTRHARPAVAAH